MAKLKVGDKVETVFGQKTKVLAAEERQAKMKKGKVIEEGEMWYLLEQPNIHCWFPAKYIKGVK